MHHYLSITLQDMESELEQLVVMVERRAGSLTARRPNNSQQEVSTRPVTERQETAASTGAHNR